MRSDEIVRSWKEEAYQSGLRDNERDLPPDNPAGVFELTDAEIIGINGGSVITVCSFMPCESLITYCQTVITFYLPTWGFCPL